MIRTFREISLEVPAQPANNVCMFIYEARTTGRVVVRRGGVLGVPCLSVPRRDASSQKNIAVGGHRRRGPGSRRSRRWRRRRRRRRRRRECTCCASPRGNARIYTIVFLCNTSLQGGQRRSVVRVRVRVRVRVNGKSKHFFAPFGAPGFFAREKSQSPLRSGKTGKVAVGKNSTKTAFERGISSVCIVDFDEFFIGVAERVFILR